MHFFKSLIAVGLLGAGLLPTLAHAQDSEMTLAQAQDEWRFQITPYVWLANFDGHIRPFRQAPVVHARRTSKQTRENLNVAAFLMGTARKNNFVIQGDMTYASVSNTEKLPRGLKAKVSTKQKTITLTAGKRVLHNDQYDQYALDLLAGIRYWDIDAKVSLPQVPLHHRLTSRFVDPIVAARYRYEFTPRFSGIMYADVGGFGVGSQITWQVFGAVNYELASNMFASLGYRHLAVDYKKSGRRLDLKMSGPMLGFTYQF